MLEKQAAIIEQQQAMMAEQARRQQEEERQRREAEQKRQEQLRRERIEEEQRRRRQKEKEEEEERKAEEKKRQQKEEELRRKQQEHQLLLQQQLQQPAGFSLPQTNPMFLQPAAQPQDHLLQQQVRLFFCKQWIMWWNHINQEELVVQLLVIGPPRRCFSSEETDSFAYIGPLFFGQQVKYSVEIN